MLPAKPAAAVVLKVETAEAEAVVRGAAVAAVPVAVGSVAEAEAVAATLESVPVANTVLTLVLPDAEYSTEKSS